MNTITQRLATVAAIATTLLLAVAPAARAAGHPAFKAEVTGQGQPVIMIPGLASPGSVWDGTVQHLCGATRQCHVLTLAGFPGQPAIEGPLLPQVEQQLSDYIRDNKLGKPVIIGHSMGGFLGMKLAADHPEQVGRLIIVDALPALGARQVPNITGAQLKQIADGMRVQIKAAPAQSFDDNARRNAATMVSGEANIERVAAWVKQSDRNTVIDSMADMMSEDLRPAMPRIQAPTLVLGSWIAFQAFAPRDALVSVYTDQYAKLPGVKIDISDTAKHFIMVDDPAWMYARIDNFLN
ncbi:alpha/beta fold hydrolase [Oxalobacteraceae bacterium A2-2]